MHNAVRRAITAIVFCIAFTAAHAHSPLQTSSPAEGVTLTTLPAETALTFKGKIRLTRVSLSHTNGSSVDLDLSGSKNFAEEFAIPLQDMGPGRYLIEWRGLGDDGHAMNGAFGFTIK